MGKASVAFGGGPEKSGFLLLDAEGVYNGIVDSDADRVFNVVCQRLPELGVAVLLVGGHAVNYYGFVRATQDIDFMVTDVDEPLLGQVMREAGFTNVAVYENVIFFSRPGSTLRVDFLKVDAETMEKLMARAVSVEYFGGHRVKVPALRDLLAMKLFALKVGTRGRKERDLLDIAHLVLENDLDVERDLKPLCEEFATKAIYSEICERIEALREDG